MIPLLLLIFSCNDTVIDTLNLEAPTILSGMRMAEAIMVSQPRGVGYQLWHEGAKVHGTYPRRAGLGAAAAERYGV